MMSLPVTTMSYWKIGDVVVGTWAHLLERVNMHPGGVAAVRGGDVFVADRDGAVPPSGPLMRGSRNLTLPITILGVSTAGGVTHTAGMAGHLTDNLAALVKVIGTGEPFTVEHRLPLHQADPDVDPAFLTVSAQAWQVDEVVVDAPRGAAWDVIVPLWIPAGQFHSSTAITETGDTSHSVTLPGTAPTSKIKVTMGNGTWTDGTSTFTITGAGGDVTIDVAARTVTDGSGLAGHRYTLTGGWPRWKPGSVTVTSSVSSTLEVFAGWHV